MGRNIVERVKKVNRIMFFWNGFMKFKWFEDEVIELIKIVFIVSLIIMNFWIFYFNVLKKKRKMVIVYVRILMEFYLNYYFFWYDKLKL